MGVVKVWLDLQISEAFSVGLEVSFSGDFCVSESRIFLPTGPFDLFMGTAYRIEQVSN